MFGVKVDPLYTLCEPLFVLCIYFCLSLVVLVIVPLRTSAHHIQHRARRVAEARAATRASFAAAYLCGRPRKTKGHARSITCLFTTY